MIFTIESNDVPVGAYEGKFVGCENTTHPEYGPGVRFDWEISTGKLAGKHAYRTTGPKPTPRNACGKVLSALAGVAPADGVQVDANRYIGKTYVLMVEATDSGATRVATAALKEDTPPF